MNRFVTVLLTGMLFIFIIVACGVPQADYDELLSERNHLEDELDECKNGADRIVAKIEKAYLEKKYALARNYIQLLQEKHPESPKNKEFEVLLVKIKSEELAETKKREAEERAGAEKRKAEAEKRKAEEKERFRLANLNNTGMWSVHYYVDDFGEPTKKAYIRNTLLIQGTFSNSATQDSRLNVKFLISTSSKISVQLYEYGGNNPVKAYSPEYYTVLIQDDEGNRLKLEAVNRLERLTFGKSHSQKVHNALLKGGSLKFVITENDTPTTIYKFTILSADWYENAYRKLKES